MKVLIGVLLGLIIAVLMGSTMEENERFPPSRLPISEQTGIYTSTFSGITPEGACYLAVTNTISGQTEVIGIPQDVLANITATPLQPTEQGTAIIKLTRYR